MPQFLDIQSGWVQSLSDDPADLTPTFHRWSDPEKDALALAQAARRPLLVRGEPGTGKTQLAQAAARYLGWHLQTVVIHPRYEAPDLLYHFDAVRRLADAQVKDRLKPDEAYWSAGPLWRAFDPQGAADLLRKAAPQSAEAGPNEDLGVGKGQIVLIDEIDKADSDLPNSLLEVLGQRGFRVPGLANRWVGQTGAETPLVLVTTNEERDLPPAFLRRCIVLNLEAPKDQYREWLIERGHAHHGPAAPLHRRLDDAVLSRVADQLVADREKVEAAGLPPPGPAEYLDLLSALLQLTAGAGETAPQRQMDLLSKLSAYAFLKHGHVEGHPGLDQARGVKLSPTLTA